MTAVVSGVPDEITFVVPGEPVAWQRTNPIPGRKHDGSLYVRLVNSAELEAYEEKVRVCAQIRARQVRWMFRPDDRFTVVLRIYRRYEGKGGDADNYIKSLYDGMTGAIWEDDRYVRGGGFQVIGPSDKPRVIVTVRRYRRGERVATSRKGSTDR